MPEIWKRRRRMWPWNYQGMPGAPANFDAWADMPSWTASETAALCLGLEPTSVEMPSFYFLELDLVEKLVTRACVVGDLKGTADAIAPTDFLVWARQPRASPILGGLLAEMDCRLCGTPELEETLPQMEESEQLAALQAENEKLTTQITALEQERKVVDNPKHRRTLYRIILGLAIRQYRFQTGGLRSPAPRVISEHLSEVGIHVTDETIRSVLDTAVQELDYEPPTTD